ncbi:unnamed protein product, partial [Polarella glacialis]
ACDDASRRPWRHEVATGEQAMTTTGGRTWDAARKLCNFLEQEWPTICSSYDCAASAHILELGAGTGWLGMTVASNLVPDGEPGSVCLTEQSGGGAMDWLEQNLAENRAAGLALSAVGLQELDWTLWEDCPDNPSSPSPGRSLPCTPGGTSSWNLLLGSDLVYNEAGVRLLPKVLKDFAARCPDLLILYAHTLHRFDMFDLDFCESLLREGLEYRAVAAENAATVEAAGRDADPLADEHAGFMEEMFPDQRVVIFQIRLQGASKDFLPWSSCLVARPPPKELKAAVVSQPRPVTKNGIVKVGRFGIILPLETEDPEDCREKELPDGSFIVRLRCLGPFGSGEHPTTELMLQALQDCKLDDLAVCDYGCGSGVLALAALVLGARRSIGVDIIPDALLAARANVEANTWAGPVDGEPRMGLFLPQEDVLEKDLDFYARYGDWRKPEANRGWEPLPSKEEGQFDLVVANIVVGPLCHSANAVQRLLRPGGEVLLAGMKEGMQVSQVKEAYSPYFDLTAVGSIDGWALLKGRLRGIQMATPEA